MCFDGSVGRVGSLAGLCLVLALFAADAKAQDAPPELVEMPPVHAPGAARTVELTIEIDAAGRARSVGCEEEVEVCAEIDRALEAARFRPATRDGRALSSRIRLAVRITPPPAPATLPPLEEAIALPDEPAEVEPAGEEPEEAPPLGVTAEVTREEPGVERLELEESRDMPGALGDPFRAVLVLPGVVPVMSGLPYFYLRGAPPAGTVYVYDGIPVPALYHLAAGPAVVHPQMVGTIDVHSGVAPIQYGNHSGGVVVGEGPAPRSEDFFAEAELRAIDVSGFVQGRVGDVSLAAATRIGYPGLLVSALSPEVDLAYWDYQARARLALGGGHRLELVALGSYDSLSLTFPDVTGTPTTSGTTLTFHRVELRQVYEDARTEVGLALRAGHDESSLIGASSTEPPSGTALDLTLFGARFWVKRREGDLRLRVGGDISGSVGRFSEPTGGPIADNTLLLLAGTHTFERTNASAHVSLEWQALRELVLIGGLRADLWLSGDPYEIGVAPRLRAVWTPDPAIAFHAAAGLAHQPAILPIPLPGLSEAPITLGLVTAAQSEIGATARMRVDDLRLRVAATLFLHHYENVVLPELFNPPDVACTAQFLCREPGLSRVRPDSWAYGLELSLRGEMGRHFAGRLSYTLSETTSAPYGTEVHYTPTYDIRHVLNLVLSYDSRAGFTAGVRAFLRSGATHGFTYLDPADLSFARYEQALPAFARLDASVAYGWDAGWADLRVTLEWMNVTFAAGGEPQGLICGSTFGPPAEACGVSVAPPIFFPNLGLRGTFR